MPTAQEYHSLEAKKGMWGSEMQKDRPILHREKEKDDYRASLKQLIQREAQPLVDEEIRQAAQELIQEQWKAIRQVSEEHKQTIRDVVEQEKVAIRARIEELKRSIVDLGMG